MEIDGKPRVFVHTRGFVSNPYIEVHEDKRHPSMSTPLVSVVMSVCNAEGFLHQAVQSVLAQSLADLEFLIVDDGSVDTSWQVLQSFNDPRIILLRNDRNLGLTRSLNRALGRAVGKYIARQDADDESLPDRLMREVAFLDAHPNVGMLSTSTAWVDENNNVIRNWHPPEVNSKLQQALLRSNCFSHGAVMFRRACIDDVGPYNENLRFAQDYDLWLRISENWDIFNLRDVLYRYRWHPNMASVDRKAEQEQCAQLALRLAITRRLEYGWARVGIGKRKTLPARFRNASRRWIAERYTWWCMGVTEPNKRSNALQFLAIALLADPVLPPAWLHLRWILARKLRLIARRQALPSGTL